MLLTCVSNIFCVDYSLAASGIFLVLNKSAVFSLLTLLSFRFRWRETSGSYVVNNCAVFFNRVESFQYLRDVKFSESMLFS